MAQLAIKGHATRGKEVIEILEMLGGINNYKINNTEENLLYCLREGDNVIIATYPNSSITSVFTLEGFLEKYPYKVGDRVLYKTYGIYLRIKSMLWNEEKEQVFYRLDSKELYVASEDKLQPYKEETMEKEEKYYDEWLLTDYLEFEDNDGAWADEVEVNLGKDYEIQIRGDKTFIVKKKSQYPKTYEECAKVLLERASVRNDIGYKGDLIVTLQKLLVCRDAYWKIAGEQMGLGEPWKPDWLNTEQDKFVLYTHNNVICLNRFVLGHNVLAFPTAEMRDAFLENFKELIESCKELL